jgi:glucokinase
MQSGMKFIIAIDLGGTIIKIGLLSNSQLLDRKEVSARSQSGLRPQLLELETIIDQLLDNHRISKEDVMGIGFSFPGLVDSLRNRIISTNKKYDDGPDIDLEAWARKKWNWPLFAENDARVALLGEWQMGAGKDCNDLAMLTFGTGIGSAVILNGQLLKGKHFQAGNLGGHFVVNHRGTICTCGNIGCVEAEASTWRLPSLLKDHPAFATSSLSRLPEPDFRQLMIHSQNNDRVAVEVLDHCISVWSAAIINMIHAFDPEKIILGGGIMKSADILLPMLQERVNQFAWTPWGKVKLVSAHHPDSAALYGAEYIVKISLNK